MMTLNLDAQFSGHVFSFLLVFTRLGTIIMLLPGLGEAYVSTRIRLLFALVVSFLLYPVLLKSLPAQPEAIPALISVVSREILVGVFFGSLLRLLMGAVEVTGSIVAVQIGLSNAMMLNPTEASQSALPSALLGMLGVLLLFMTGLDHMMLRAMVDTYTLFPVADPAPVSDMAHAFVKLISSSFKIGVELAAPFLIVGLLIYTALGIVQKLVPQVQLFLVMIPLQIWGGLSLFAITIAVIMSIWLRYFSETLSQLVAR